MGFGLLRVRRPGGEEGIDLLDLLRRLRWEDAQILRVVAPPVRHENFEVACMIRVLLVVHREDVGALEGLYVQSENVVEEEDTAFHVRLPSDIYSGQLCDLSIMSTGVYMSSCR